MTTYYTLEILPNNNEVAKFYIDHTYKHEGDCGLDLYMPEDLDIVEGETKIIPLGFRARMIEVSTNKPVPWIIIPRSSISKTPLRLANSQGLIDAGYRGELMVALDHLIKSKSESILMETKITKGMRLVQACAPGYIPFNVELVDSLDETTRGENGFGSTGI